MVIDLDDFQIESDKLMASFSRLFDDLGVDEHDDQQIYNTVTVFLGLLLADGMWDEYGDDLEKLDVKVKDICTEIGEDMEGKIRAFLEVMKKKDYCR